jgi:hypothetical protein
MANVLNKKARILHIQAGSVAELTMGNTQLNPRQWGYSEDEHVFVIRTRAGAFQKHPMIVLMPVATETDLPQTAVTGSMCYVTSEDSYYVKTDTSWGKIGGGDFTLNIAANGGLTGNGKDVPLSVDFTKVAQKTDLSSYELIANKVGVISDTSTAADDAKNYTNVAAIKTLKTDLQTQISQSSIRLDGVWYAIQGGVPSEFTTTADYIQSLIIVKDADKDKGISCMVIVENNVYEYGATTSDPNTYGWEIKDPSVATGRANGFKLGDTYVTLDTTKQYTQPVSAGFFKIAEGNGYNGECYGKFGSVWVWTVMPQLASAGQFVGIPGNVVTLDDLPDVPQDDPRTYAIERFVTEEGQYYQNVAPALSSYSEIVSPKWVTASIPTLIHQDLAGGTVAGIKAIVVLPQDAYDAIPEEEKAGQRILYMTPIEG